MTTILVSARKQRNLQGHSEPVAVVTPLVDEVEVGRFQRVAPGQLVRLGAEQVPRSTSVSRT